MYSIYEEITEQLETAVKNAISRAISEGELPEAEIPKIMFERPREEAFGDLSTNLAMQMAKQMKMAPRNLAQVIVKHIKTEGTYIDKVEVAGPGFINFYFNNEWLYRTLRLIDEKREHYGEINIGNGEKVMVEFVSANPTGPLHMGNARGGALGDCIASVLEKAGYNVTREYYINDAGNQIEKFGISLEARYLQQFMGEDSVPFPEDGYHGEDIIDHVKDYIKEHGDNLLDKSPEERRKALVEYALPRNLKRIRDGLTRYRINYDVWFSESSLYEGEIEETMNILRERGYVVEKDGAVWLSAEKTGLEKDEVLIRQNGYPTYMASDIAYHRNKFVKRGFDRVINLWGADHHGHVARMKAAMEALGISKDRLQIVLFQLVHLYKDGEIVRMSKRTGRAITLDDLLDEVGVDAARFFFNMKTSGSHLDFDMDLAVEQSNNNPVFYVQYAHARICSILRKLNEENIEMLPADRINLALLTQPEELALIKKLAEYPEEIRMAAQTLEPSRLTHYVIDVASHFHRFYNACRVKGEREDLMQARLFLIHCTRIVIKNVLDLLKIEAPEKM
ncbi:arginine--tRNA ligase ArgS [Thermoclostridium stercorarium subsp. stercorarium DSM 8532]|uniref:Arginine--tRNA ligase n=1 Tax=Thermoclostridium stercorarium (strain ATCC 35414 / DSM 8532 / NCIMB 11754) TaxID=1121335 RepID=L7VV70_THES1|nr:arginine--tRNA ligase [Thermoclostridium stercorarium]AGC69488.1 arginine--tRNA ligase ArgS [Thermoclostridium stercorarium subsp. stercorarium DSM 8532]AGI40441.1 arginyl-tRNA synthetase [Thermoclostridium stercorarium subsp. stercorarium DSM 8532]UZQ85433.1 arginine--tRNA ligase [Thermoclostridium stercorarium]